MSRSSRLATGAAGVIVALVAAAAVASADPGPVFDIDERGTEFSIVGHEGDSCVWEATIAWGIVNHTDQRLTLTAVDYLDSSWTTFTTGIDSMTVTVIDMGGLAPGRVIEPYADISLAPAVVRYTISCDPSAVWVYVRASTAAGDGYGRAFTTFVNGSELPIGPLGMLGLALAGAAVLAVRQRRSIRLG